MGRTRGCTSCSSRIEGEACSFSSRLRQRRTVDRQFSFAIAASYKYYNQHGERCSGFRGVLTTGRRLVVRLLDPPAMPGRPPGRGRSRSAADHEARKGVGPSTMNNFDAHDDTTIGDGWAGAGVRSAGAIRARDFRLFEV